jgi:hypothetical protein
VSEDKGKNVGAGCADVTRDDGSVEWMMAKSPRLALARAWRIDLVPWDFTIATTFSTASAGPNLGVTSETDVDTDLLITKVNVDVQDPNAFVGDVFKAERDYYFALTSGMQVGIEIEGMFKRRISPVPIRDLAYFASESQPWILLAEQFFKLDFVPTTALPFAGTTFTVSFIGKCATDPSIIGKSYTACFCELDKLGYNTTQARRVFGA